MENSELAIREEDFHRDDHEFQQVLRSLQKEWDLLTGTTVYSHQGFWTLDFLIKPVLSFQKHFVAFDDDLILTSCPQSGTTWLKALSFSIVNRHKFTLPNSPLLTSNPHALVLNLEFDVFDKLESMNSIKNTPKPRLLSTHVPYSSLPLSIKNSNCKIVYICRNPMDQYVSTWHFLTNNNFGENNNKSSVLPRDEEYFDQFSRGVHLFGPSWDHILGFWKASLESPKKILFLKYEDLKKDVVSEMKKLAEFLGFPFSEEEEKEGVVEKIAEFCSIGNMKSLKVNVEGQRPSGATHRSYFRKGEVGEWMNHLTPSMVERMKRLLQEKFQDSDLKIYFE